MDFEMRLDELKAFIVPHVPTPHDGQDARQFIATHFMARAVQLANDIQLLARQGSSRNAWALVRMLADRYAHIRYLTEHNQFEQFQKASFAQRYHDLQVTMTTRLLSDTEKRNAQQTMQSIKDFLNEDPKKPAHYWRRPKPETLFGHSNNNPSITKAGYEKMYAIPSAVVHPTHDDSAYPWEHDPNHQTLFTNTYLSLAGVAIHGLILTGNPTQSEQVMQHFQQTAAAVISVPRVQ